jgi:hypothetical protein
MLICVKDGVMTIKPGHQTSGNAHNVHHTTQETPTRGKITGTAGASIKTSRRINKKTGYNNTHKENACITSGRRPRNGRV